MSTCIVFLGLPLRILALTRQVCFCEFSEKINQHLTLFIHAKILNFLMSLGFPFHIVFMSMPFMSIFLEPPHVQSKA